MATYAMKYSKAMLTLHTNSSAARIAGGVAEISTPSPR
jgi:hypothetical protein